MPELVTPNETVCPALAVTLDGWPVMTGGKLLITRVATALVAEPAVLVRIAKYPAASAIETLAMVKLVVDDPEITEPEPVLPSVSGPLVVPPEISNHKLLATGMPGLAVNEKVTLAPGLVATRIGLIAVMMGFGVTVNEATLLVDDPLALVRMQKTL